jgi:hypothetical protein
MSQEHPPNLAQRRLANIQWRVRPSSLGFALPGRPPRHIGGAALERFARCCGAVFPPFQVSRFLKGPVRQQRLAHQHPRGLSLGHLAIELERHLPAELLELAPELSIELHREDSSAIHRECMVARGHHPRPACRNDYIRKAIARIAEVATGGPRG